MNHRVSRSLTAILAAGALVACADPPLDDDGRDTATTGAPASSSAVGHFAPDQLIVKLHAPYDGAAPLTLGGRRLVPIQQLPSGTWHMRLEDTRRARRDDLAAAAAETLAAIDEVRADPAVAYAHENRAFELSLVPNDPEARLSPPGRQAWSHSLIDLYAAWDVTTGSSAVRIALIDSGRRNHPELQIRWGAGWDFIYNDSDPTDDPPTHPFAYDWAHGVHVAGIAGGRANNNLGGAGVCWSCPILPLRVTPLLRDDLINPIGIAYITEIENAIAWAAGPDGGPRRAEVINLSLNDPSSVDCNEVRFTGLRTQLTRAIDRGVVVVSSAGNRRFTQPVTPTAAARVPSTCPGVISVMASGPGGAVPEYSARGAGVDLVAPGGGNDLEMHYGEGVGCPDPVFGSGTNGVFSPWSYRSPAAPTTDVHCYRHLSGTSMSAPHVTGVVALMRSVNGNLTPAQIEHYLLATARPDRVTCPSPGACGAGMLDAHAAVLAARDGLAPDIDVTPASLAFPATRLTTVSSPQPLVVRNTGAGTLAATVFAPAQITLACASTGCTCASASSCTVTATASAAVTLHVRYAPTVAGAFASSLTITSNDPDENPRTVPVTGTGTYSDARISPDVMHFGFVVVGATSPPQWAQVSNAGTAPLTISGLGATGDVAHYSVTPPGPFPITVAPGASAQFAVRCIPTSAGRKTMTLRLTNDANIQDAPIDVRCEAVAPDARLIVDPPGPAFGAVQIGSTATRTVRVLDVSQGTTQLVFTLARPAAPFGLTCTSGCTCTASSCSGTVTSGQAGAALALTFTPTTTTSHAATLAFTSNSPTLPTSSIQTSGSGGTAVMTVIDPPDGLVELTEGALAKTATIRNTGDVPLRLDGWQIDPTVPMAEAFDVSSSATVSLAPGGEHTWKLSCQPTWRTGTYSAPLVVESSLGVRMPVTVSCTMGPIGQPSTR